MSYRKPLLKRVLACKELMDEMAALFKCEPADVPHWIGIVLQLASDGQAMGFKQASVAQGKTRPIGRPRKEVTIEEEPIKAKAKAKKTASSNKNYRNPLRTTAVKDASERPSPHDAILGVMKPFETVSMDTICERIVDKGWQPTSVNLKAYVQHLLSRECHNKVKGRKGAVDRTDVNQYRLREWYVKSLQKDKKFSKPAKVIPLRPTTVAPPPVTNGAASHG
jgi:hypothetical protein